MELKAWLPDSLHFVLLIGACIDSHEPVNNSLNWNRPDWTGLDWLGWAGLDWTGLNGTGRNSCMQLYVFNKCCQMFCSEDWCWAVEHSFNSVLWSLLHQNVCAKQSPEPHWPQFQQCSVVTIASECVCRTWLTTVLATFYGHWCIKMCVQDSLL